MPKIIDTIVIALPKLVDGIANGIIDNIDKIIEAGVKLFVAIVADVPRIVSGIVLKIPEIIQSIVNGFGEHMSEMSDAGKRLLEGLWEGIKNTGDWLKDKIGGFFGGIVDGIKDILGIHSPSTVFAEMGENMALGIGVGFDNEFSSIRDDMNGQMDFTANADVKVNRGAMELNDYESNSGFTSTEKQPLLVVVQLSSGIELGRALIENINQAKRADGLAY